MTATYREARRLLGRPGMISSTGETDVSSRYPHYSRAVFGS